MVEMLLTAREELQLATFLAAMEFRLAGNVFRILWNVLNQNKKTGFQKILKAGFNK